LKRPDATEGSGFSQSERFRAENSASSKFSGGSERLRPAEGKNSEFSARNLSKIRRKRVLEQALRTCIHQRNRRIFAMIFSPARKRKTPCTQRVHKFYGDEGGRKISRIDTDFVYEYRFLHNLRVTPSPRTAKNRSLEPGGPQLNNLGGGVFTYSRISA
jgi:hypothetical protein